MKSLGYAPDEEDMNQMEEHEFYSSLIIKIGARCVTVGGCEESELSQTKMSAGCGAEYGEQTSRNRFEEHKGSELGFTNKDSESGNAS